MEDQYFFSKFCERQTNRDKAKRKSPISNCITQKTQDEQPFWNVEQSTMKINPKNQLTLRFSHQYNQEGPGKPAEEFLDESMTENEEKNETMLGIIS